MQELKRCLSLYLSVTMGEEAKEREGEKASLTYRLDVNGVRGVCNSLTISFGAAIGGDCVLV